MAGKVNVCDRCTSTSLTEVLCHSAREGNLSRWTLPHTARCRVSRPRLSFQEDHYRYTVEFYQSHRNDRTRPSCGTLNFSAHITLDTFLPYAKLTSAPLRGYHASIINASYICYSTMAFIGNQIRPHKRHRLLPGPSQRSMH